jgi:hypothetical protein
LAVSGFGGNGRAPDSDSRGGWNVFIERLIDPADAPMPCVTSPR